MTQPEGDGKTPREILKARWNEGLEQARMGSALPTDAELLALLDALPHSQSAEPAARGIVLDGAALCTVRPACTHEVNMRIVDAFLASQYSPQAINQWGETLMNLLDGARQMWWREVLDSQELLHAINEALEAYEDADDA